MPRMTVIATCAVLTWVGAALGAAELPLLLRQRLSFPSSPIVAHYQWQAMRGLRVVDDVVAAVGEKLELELPIVDLVLVPAARVVSRLPVEGRVVADIWVELTGPDGKTTGEALVSTTLEPAALIAAIADAGWVPIPGSERAFAPPLDDEGRARARSWLEAQPTLDPQGVLYEVLVDANDKVVVLSGGWLLLLPRMRYIPSLPDESAAVDQTQGGETEPDLPFPLSGLGHLSGSTYAAIAFDVPGNDGGADEVTEHEASETGPDTVWKLRARLRDLEERDARAVKRRLGDLLLVVSQVDGGLAFDMTARRPGGGGEDDTARFLEMSLLLLRFALLRDGPDLARELGNATVSPTRGEVRASGVVSLASLHDAFEAEIERQREIRDLQHRLDEVERPEECRREEAAQAGGGR